MMPKVSAILSQVGSSDVAERVRDKGASTDAMEEVAMEFVQEIHVMLKALLMMHGRMTGETTEADAVHSKR